MKKPDKDCEFCGGTGTVTADVWDDDSKQYQPVGEQKCECVFTIDSDYDEPDDQETL